jgi:hypothetical protein
MNEETPEEAVRVILERMREGGLWQPHGLGLSYVKEGDRTVKLISQENTPMSAQARIRMRMLVESIDWLVDESICELIDVEHLSLEEKHIKEMMMRQEMAQGWKCSCGTPLSAFPLEEGVWKHEGQQEMVLPTGEKEMVEQWHVLIQCPTCDAEIPTDPYDYGLLAGDESMLVYNTGKVTYTAVDRPAIIDRVDNKLAESMIILGTFCPFNGDLLPPHVRGAVVTFRETKETGEEE